MNNKFIAAIVSLVGAILVGFPQTSVGQDYSTASAINDEGDIVGGSLLDNLSGFHAFVLSDDKVTDLGTFGGFGSLAFAVNNRGDAVGQSDTATNDEFGNAISLAFLANKKGVHNLGSLPGLRNSQAFGINKRRQIVGRAYNNAEDRSRPFDFRAFLYEQGVMRDIGTLGGALAEAFGINDRGQVVGDSSNASGEQHAFLYDRGVMRDLGTLGGTFSQARSINDRSQIVGQSAFSPTSRRTHAFLYEGGVMRDLGTLGGTTSRAEFINSSGEIVGFSRTAAGDTHAFLYTKGVMQDLGTLGGTYSAAFGINEDGDIVGEADTATGDTHAFLIEDGVMRDLDSQLPR